tara:strand:+ start:2420 stop:3955 length:1536 start_codon:yes stop_codon:yes gene_type:complete
MQGINQLHNEIKNLSDQQLVQLMQDPRSTLPKYMVLAEIEGRKPIRQAFDAANAQQPMTTIADESVQEFMGGNPMPADPMANPMGAGPMMGAQGFASGKSTSKDEDFFDYLIKLNDDEKKQVYQQVMKDRTNRMKEMTGNEKLGQFLGGGMNLSENVFSLLGGSGFDKIPVFDGTPESEAFVEAAKDVMSKRAKFQEGGFIGGLRSLGEFTGVIDEEGEIDPVQAALLGLTFVPGLGLVARAGQGLFRAGKGLASLVKEGAPQAASFAGKQGQKLVSKPNPNIVKGKGFTMKDPGAPDRVFAPGRAYTAGVAVPAGIASLSGIGDAAQERDAKEQERLAKILQERNDELNKNNAGGLNDLISGPVKSDRKKMSGLELAQLGGIIAGSVDLSDLGKGIGALATATAKDKQAAALAERKLGIDERRVTAMEESNVLKQNQFLIEQLATQMEVDYPLFLSASDKIAKGKTPADNEQQAFDRYTKNLAEYQSIMGMGVASNNDDAFASQYIRQAG